MWDSKSECYEFSLRGWGRKYYTYVKSSFQMQYSDNTWMSAEISKAALNKCVNEKFKLTSMDLWEIFLFMVFSAQY